ERFLVATRERIGRTLPFLKAQPFGMEMCSGSPYAQRRIERDVRNYSHGGPVRFGDIDGVGLTVLACRLWIGPTVGEGGTQALGRLLRLGKGRLEQAQPGRI